jgi:hypothetical protein
VNHLLEQSEQNRFRIKVSAVSCLVIETRTLRESQAGQFIDTAEQSQSQDSLPEAQSLQPTGDASAASW